MKKIVCMVAMVFASLMVLGQNQQGYVKTRGRLASNGSVIAGKRLSGATISVKNGNAVVSGNNGAFSLRLPSQNYYLQGVQKQGYVLSDPDVLNRQYVQSKNPLELVMEDKAQREADRRALERIISSNLYAQLQKRGDELEAQKEQNQITEEKYRALLQKLNQDQDDNEKIIKEMADRYSKIDFDHVDDFNRRISDLILNGRLTEADSLLRTKGDLGTRRKELDKHHEAIQQKRAELTKSENMEQRMRTDLASDYYTKFEICKMLHQNDSAAYYLDQRASLDTMNVEWQVDAGSFLCLYIADYRKALDIYQRSLKNVMENEGKKSLESVVLNEKIAQVYLEIGKYDEAVKLYKKVIDDERELYNNNSRIIIASLNGLGVVYSTLNKSNEAEQYYMEALSNVACIVDDSVHTFINLGGLYYETGRYNQALQSYESALSLMDRIQGNTDNWKSVCFEGISSVYREKDEFSKSEEYLNKALEIKRLIFGENHPDVANGYINYGVSLNEKGKYQDALDYFSKALAIDTLFLSKNHPIIGVTYNNMGLSYANQGNYDKAVNYYQKALGIYKVFYGGTHERLATTLVNLGASYEELKNYSKALECEEKALNIMKTIYGEQHSKVSIIYNNIANTLIEVGDYTKAENVLEKALSINVTLNGEQHSSVAVVYNSFGRLYNQMGNYSEAAKYMEKAFPIIISTYGEEHPNVAITYYNVGVIYKKNEDYSKALELTEKAYNIMLKFLPEDHHVMQQFKNGLAEIKEKKNNSE